MAVVLIALAILFKARIFKKSTAISLLAIIILSGLTVYGAFQLKSYQAARITASSGTVQAINYNDAESLQDNAASSRLDFWRRAWDIFKDRPLTGGGLESFADYHRQYLQPPYYYSADPHNFYLKTLVETGIFGFVVFTFFAVGLGYCLIRLLLKIRDGFGDQNENITAKIFLVAMAGGVFTGLMNNGVNFGWSYPADLIIFFGAWL